MLGGWKRVVLNLDVESAPFLSRCVVSNSNNHYYFSIIILVLSKFYTSFIILLNYIQGNGAGRRLMSTLSMNKRTFLSRGYFTNVHHIGDTCFTFNIFDLIRLWNMNTKTFFALDFWLCFDAHERYIDWETLFNNFDILYKESKLLNTVSQSQHKILACLIHQ